MSTKSMKQRRSSGTPVSQLALRSSTPAIPAQHQPISQQPPAGQKPATPQPSQDENSAPVSLPCPWHDTKFLWELADLLGKLEKLKKDFTNADNAKRLHESRLNDLQGRYNQAINDRKKAEDDCKEFNIENSRLVNQLEELRKHLEDATLARVELENSVQSLKEELTFKDSIHRQELLEVNRQVEISEIDGRLSEQYEAKLQQSLQELREQCEDQLAFNREDIKKLYEDKVMIFEQTLNRNSIQAGNAIDELRSKIDSLNSKIVQLEHANNNLKARNRSFGIQMLEVKLNRQLSESIRSLANRRRTYDCHDELNRQLSQSIRSSRKTPNLTIKNSSLAKRRRTYDCHDVESDYWINSSFKVGGVKIVDVEANGKYIKIHNETENEIAIGGWLLVCKTGDNTIQHKFNRSTKIDGKATITIWSADVGVIHNPPFNIVMKQQKWEMADEMADKMRTFILNAEGEEVADFKIVFISK